MSDLSEFAQAFDTRQTKPLDHSFKRAVLAVMGELRAAGELRRNF